MIAAVLMALMTFADKAQAHPLDTSLIEEEWAEAYWNHFDSWKPPIVIKPTFYRRVDSNVERWRPLVTIYFQPDDIDRALCLMSYESGGNPDAYNSSSGASGLMQFIPSTWRKIPIAISGGDPFNGERNIAAAAYWKALIDKENGNGWTQWSPYKKGLCQ